MFSGSQVRAIREDRMTQTRRIACAVICEQRFGDIEVAQECAEAIRARGNA